jgi:hypothetical protein
VTALLVEAAESRMQLFESGERRKRCRDVTEHTLRKRAQIQDVTILRHRDQQGVCRRQSLGEPPLLYEFAYSPDLKFHGRGMIHIKTPDVMRSASLAFYTPVALQ